MFATPAITVWLLALAALSRAVQTATLSTSCTRSGTNTKHTSFVTATSSCTVTKTNTITKTINSTPTTTSTVFDTITATDSTQTNTATETSTETDTQTSTSTLYSTVYATSMSTFTVVSYWQHTINTIGARALGEHAETALEARATTTHTGSTSYGVVCSVYKCAVTTTKTSSKITQTAAIVTEFNTETVTTTVTPQASTTTTETVTTSETSTVYVSAQTTVTTTIEASQWATRTAKPTFYIAASNAPNVADGTRLGFYSAPYGTEDASFSTLSSPSLFEYDPANGSLYDASGRQGFNDDGTCLGEYQQACVYFLAPSGQIAYPKIPLSASINPNNNLLSLTAPGGYSVPETLGNGNLIIGSVQIATLNPVTLVAQIVDQH